MFEIPAEEALRSVASQKDRNHHFPGKPDPRYRKGGLFPHLYPKFQLSPDDRIFTMGSCFARHIEDALAPQGFRLPVKGFAIPDGELPYPGPHLLNEYNAGTISQRLKAALGQGHLSEEAGVEAVEGGALDLMLHLASQPVSLERLRARRQEIEGLYAQACQCEGFVLTLGLVEAWYDLEYQCYLNRAPSFRKIRALPGRFAFRRLDIEDVVGLLRPVLHELLHRSVRKVLLTVSPVPMEVSFMPGDIVTNNAYSKATLRGSCELLSRNEPCIDYFPSYEIVSSFGVAAGFIDDGVHPRMSVVEQVIGHLADHYLPWGICTREEMEERFASWADQGLRVMIYPAGRQAQDLLQESPALRRALVAFGDGDPAKQGLELGGVPVLGPEAISQAKVDVVLLASDQFEAEILRELAPLETQGIQVVSSRSPARRALEPR